MSKYEFVDGDIAGFDIEGMSDSELGVLNMLVINAEVAMDDAAGMGGSDRVVRRWRRMANECGVLRNRIAERIGWQ